MTSLRTIRALVVPLVVLGTGVGCSAGDGEGAAGTGGPPAVDSAASPVENAVPAVESAAPGGASDEVRELRGMMTYMADAARFTDCTTGASFVMAQEGEYVSAERAYLDAPHEAGAPVFVTLRGMLTRRPGMEGGVVDAVVVTEFGSIHPGQGCGEEPVTARLEGTEWRLVALPGAGEVPPDAGATLLLDPDTRRSSGSTGCNRFTGRYDLEGGRLTVGLTAMTRMACPEPLATVETDFIEALRVAGAYRFVGAFLELLGEAGPVARFAPPD